MTLTTMFNLLTECSSQLYIQQKTLNLSKQERRLIDTSLAQREDLLFSATFFVNSYGSSLVYKQTAGYLHDKVRKGPCAELRLSRVDMGIWFCLEDSPYWAASHIGQAQGPEGLCREPRIRSEWWKQLCCGARPGDSFSSYHACGDTGQDTVPATPLATLQGHRAPWHLQPSS